MTFGLKIHSKVSSDWSSILAFKGNGGLADATLYGDRAPAIFYNKQGHLHFCNSVSGNKNYYIDKTINLNQWYRIEIEQVLIGGKVRRYRYQF